MVVAIFFTSDHCKKHWCPFFGALIVLIIKSDKRAASLYFAEEQRNSQFSHSVRKIRSKAMNDPTKNGFGDLVKKASGSIRTMYRTYRRYDSHLFIYFTVSFQVVLCLVVIFTKIAGHDDYGRQNRTPLCL